MRKQPYEYGTLGYSLERLFAAPASLFKQLQEVRQRVRDARAIRKALAPVADLNGYVSQYGHDIRFTCEQGPDVSRVMATFGGIWKKDWDKYSGRHTMSRAEKYLGTWDVQISVAPGSNCKIRKVEATRTYTDTVYELEPGSCDPLTSSATVISAD